MATWFGKETRPEIEDGDAERVTRGMELLAWQYPAGTWAALITERKAGVAKKQRRNLVLAAGAMIGCLVATFASASWRLPTAALVGALVLLVPTAVAAIMLHSRRGVRLTALGREQHDPPWVRLTSTGVIAGPVARLWKGETTRLVDLRLISGVLRLEFTFGPLSELADRLEIPIPEALQDHAVEVTKLLAERIGVRFGAAPEEIEAARQVARSTREPGG